jgi:hypothetical protein
MALHEEKTSCGGFQGSWRSMKTSLSWLLRSMKKTHEASRFCPERWPPHNNGRDGPACLPANVGQMPRTPSV